MSVLEKLQAASFRGVGFLVNTESKAGGKKTVTHEFVNNDKRFTEELGLLPPSFSIEALVHGDDAIDQRLALERVLDIPGLGTLVHPIYGTIDVKSTTYTVNSNQTNIGEFRFAISFESSEAVVTPGVVTLTNSAVATAADSARTALDGGLESSYFSTILPVEISEAITKGTEIYDSVNDTISSTVGTIRSKVATFTRVVATGKRNIATIVQAPFSIKENLKALYSSALDVVNTPADLFDSWNRLIDFGFLDIKKDVITPSRERAQGNKSILSEHTRLTAFVSLTEAAVYKEQPTEIELNADRKIIDDNYKRLLEDFTEDIDTENVPVLAQDPVIRAAISDLRVLASKVFDQKEQNAWKVVTISPNLTSMSVTAHRFYGNFDTLNELQNLNPGVNHSRVSGDIQAVSG